MESQAFDVAAKPPNGKTDHYYRGGSPEGKGNCTAKQEEQRVKGNHSGNT